MIDYIKDYCVSNIDYDYIINNMKKSTLEALSLASDNVKETLKYYNSLGLSKDISKIILKRPDLVLMPKDNLVNLFNKIDKKVLAIIIDKDIDDLILFGI